VQVCIFYLVLRGLDTVEDDMKYPLEEKIPMLRKFPDLLYDRSFKLFKCTQFAVIIGHLEVQVVRDLTRPSWRTLTK